MLALFQYWGKQTNSLPDDSFSKHPRNVKIRKILHTDYNIDIEFLLSVRKEGKQHTNRYKRKLQ